jgi:hypothetical protein
MHGDKGIERSATPRTNRHLSSGFAERFAGRRTDSPRPSGHEYALVLELILAAHHCAVYPPSMASWVPVTNRERITIGGGDDEQEDTSRRHARTSVFEILGDATAKHLCGTFRAATIVLTERSDERRGSRNQVVQSACRKTPQLPGLISSGCSAGPSRWR